MADRETVIEFDSVTKSYRLFSERNQDLKRAILRGRRATFAKFTALQDVSFKIGRGESFGIIGTNGAGKSTSLKLIAGTLIPDEGKVITQGTISALLELGAGFHPELTGKENVFLNGALLGISKKTLTQRFDEIVEFSGIGDHIDSPVKTYSSGMYARLGFSVAINVDPDILLIDEVLAVGDAQFQRKCLEKIEDFRDQNKTVVFVSHGMGQVRALTDRAAWVSNGQLVRVGPSAEVVDEYEHVTLDSRTGNELEHRTGSGEARVTVDDVTHQSVTLGTHDLLELEFSIQVSGYGPDSALGFWVRRLDGQLLAWCDTRMGPLFKLQPGTINVKHTIESLPLLPGSYVVSTVLFEPLTNHVVDEHSWAARLEVGMGPGPDHEGSIDLGGRWTY
jgi:ABC-type polysaccharide/polyol phosphate transport system ATPase subunit